MLADWDVGWGSIGGVNLWDLETGRIIHSLAGHHGYVDCLAFTSDGAKLVSACTDGELNVWDTRSGRCLCQRHFDLRVMTISFGRQNSLVVAEDRIDALPAHWEFLIEDPS